jgi:toxin-antitoxin system PIN domain toxin
LKGHWRAEYGVILIDANLLVYACHEQSAQHASSRRWLEAQLSGNQPVRFAWLTLWAFLRITTNPRIFTRPLSPDEAAAMVSAWLEQPNVAVLEPGERHWSILQETIRSGQATGPLMMDAVLAALAIEHGATLCTTDRDFARFAKLEWLNPL